LAKKEVPEDEGVSQEWLASYADAMTLLLAFFIMMFAFALIDEGKYFDFKVGVMAALGVPDPLTDNTDSILEKGTGVQPEVGLTPLTPSEAQELAEQDLRDKLASAGTVTVENAEDLRDLLEQQFALAGAGEFVEVGIDERGVFIRFDGRVLFDSGQTELDNNGLTLLATAADILSIIDNPLEVEGHTDNQPTNGGVWPSNWELSGARAARVVRWLIEPGELPPLRLTALGVADTRPRATNNTAEGRQQNRRVEIVTRIRETPSAAEQQLLDNTSLEPTDTAPVDGAPADGAADGAIEGDGTLEQPVEGEVVVTDPDAPGADGSVDPNIEALDEEPVTLEDITTIEPIGDPTGDPLTSP
jgi:chemotaxis protein MotB